VQLAFPDGQQEADKLWGWMEGRLDLDQVDTMDSTITDDDRSQQWDAMTFADSIKNPGELIDCALIIYFGVVSFCFDWHKK
jgi:hypothetical protein